MGDVVDEAIAVPVFFIVVAIMDYAAWSVFWALDGYWGILYMVFLLIVEFFFAAAWVKSKMDSF